MTVDRRRAARSTKHSGNEHRLGKFLKDSLPRVPKEVLEVTAATIPSSLPPPTHLPLPSSLLSLRIPFARRSDEMVELGSEGLITRSSLSRLLQPKSWMLIVSTTFATRRTERYEYCGRLALISYMPSKQLRSASVRRKDSFRQLRAVAAEPNKK